MSMGTAEELADQLDRLKSEPEHPLRGFANARRDQPPFSVRLAAWATELAAELDARYGDLIVLQVGHLNYPARTLRSVRPRTARPPLLDPLRTAVIAVEHLEVRSGYHIRSTVLIQNLDERPLVLRTNGVVQSVIVDPLNCEVTGSFAGAQTLPLVRFQAEPGQAISAPILVGSASLRPEFGYSVPPGLWALEAILEIEGAGRYRSSQLPITIVS
jgi:hypothetical protein